MTTPETTPPTSRLGQLLESLEAGDTMRDADEMLAELVEAVENTGGKGSVTISITLERRKPGVVVVTPTIAHKVPKMPANAALRYVAPDGSLVERDPAQREFAFQDAANVTPILAESKAK